jgi:transposase
MTRTHGWATRGEVLIDKVPHGHWKTLTFIAGLRHDGIVAPCVLDGPINGETFTAWVEQLLNPIEEMFSKLKRLLRKANERSVEATWRRIGKLLDRFPPSECANYIREAGYASI